MSQARIFPFRRVSVDHMVRGVTRVWWELERTFNDPGPYYFQLQVGHTGVDAAYDDWKNVGGPVVDNYLAYDDTWRDTGGVMVSHYRVLLTTNKGAYVSQPVGVYGELEEHDWVISREIVRKEKLRHDKASVPGYLIKAIRYGTPCRTCRDQLTQEVTNFECPICLGTGFETGYYPPLPMQCWDVSPRVINEKQDDKLKGTTREQSMVTARALGFPQIDKGDIWVNSKSDERWIVDTIKVAAAMRGVPIVYEISMDLLPISNSIYLMEVGGEPAERPGPFLPVEGCGAVLVTHDFNEPDALTYKDATGCGVTDADVFVFKKIDYDAAFPGNPSKDKAIAHTFTRVNGRWEQGLKLDIGQYVIMFEKFGEYGPDFTHINVTADSQNCVLAQGTFAHDEEELLTEDEVPMTTETLVPVCEPAAVVKPPPVSHPLRAYKKFKEDDEFWRM